MESYARTGHDLAIADAKLAHVVLYDELIRLEQARRVANAHLLTKL
jgi:hypothetical protein